MKCRDLADRTTDYFEDALPAPEREQFLQHAANCTHCSRFVAQMRTTIRLLGLLGDDEITKRWSGRRGNPEWC